MKKYIIALSVFAATAALADNDVHTGELSGDYSGESHIDSVWENTYVKDGEKVIFSGSSRLSVSTNYTRANFTRASLTSARFDGAILTDANFTGANLTSASFYSLRLYDGHFTEFAATLTGADFTDAIIKGVKFGDIVSKGFTESQLKSTKSYKEKDLSGIKLNGNNISGWDFSGQNLSSAKFSGATLTGADFTDAIIKGVEFWDIVSKGFTESQLKSTKSYKEKDLSGIKLSQNNISGWDFSGQNLSSADFYSTTLTDTNFTNTNLKSANIDYSIIKGANFSGAVGFTESQLKSTKSYKEKDLSGIKLSNNNMSGWDFSGQNLSSADFYYATLTGTNFTNANLSSTNIDYSIIKGANFSGAVGFTEWQLKSTESYKEKDLSGIGLSNNNMSGWDFSGQNLQNSRFCYATLSDVNFKQADLRGADLTGITGSPKTQNTIWTDGEIKNFSMESVDDSLTIRAYVPATSGGEMINAKIADDATISGGAVLTLEEGAILEIMAGKTLTIADNSEIIFNVDVVSDNTKILLNSGSTLAFGTDSKVTINLDGVISPEDSYTFSVIEAATDACISGADAISKDNLVLNVNGEAYDSDKWGFNFDPTTGALTINVNVPEPATVAAIFGAVALVLAVYRRRR